MSEKRRGPGRTGGDEDDLLERAKALAGRGRRTVEELARKVMGRVKGGGGAKEQAGVSSQAGDETRGKGTASRTRAHEEPDAIGASVAPEASATRSRKKPAARGAKAAAAPVAKAPSARGAKSAAAPVSKEPAVRGAKSAAAPVSKAPAVRGAKSAAAPVSKAPAALGDKPRAEPVAMEPSARVERLAATPLGPRAERWALAGGIPLAGGSSSGGMADLSWVELPPDERPATVHDFTSEELAGVDLGLPELPERYDELRVVLLARDPGWLYAYWDLSDEVRARLSERQGALALRLHDVTDLEFDGQNSWWRSLHWISPEASHAYLPAPATGRAYLVELGLYQEASMGKGVPRFLPLTRSSGAFAPEAGPSDSTEEVFTALSTDGPPHPPEAVSSLSQAEDSGGRGPSGSPPGERPVRRAFASDPGMGGPEGGDQGEGDRPVEGVTGQEHASGKGPIGPGPVGAPPPWSGEHAPARGAAGPGAHGAPPPWSGVHVEPSSAAGAPPPWSGVHVEPSSAAGAPPPWSGVHVEPSRPPGAPQSRSGVPGHSSAEGSSPPGTSPEGASPRRGHTA